MQIVSEMFLSVWPERKVIAQEKVVHIPDPG